MNNRNRRRRGCMALAGYRQWNNYPYYDGPCPGAAGTCRCECDDGDDDREGCRRGRRRRCRREGGRANALFTAWLPMAVAANGIIPLVAGNPCRKRDFEVNSGLITVEEAGTYLATYNVHVPEGAALNTTLTLNVDDASQSSAIATIAAEAAGTTACSAQAIFEADEGATLSLRTSDAINVSDPSAQPMFTLSLVQLEE